MAAGPDRLLVLVGVEPEARGLRRRLRRWPSARGVVLRAVGLGAEALEDLDAEIRVAAAGAVLVAGLAGGCAPDVAPGDVIVASAVSPDAGGGLILPDPRLLARATRALASASLPMRTGPLVTTARVLDSPAAKARCWRAHGALAADMESARVLAWARRAGLPALAVRAIADGPGETLPAALAAAIGPGGRVSPIHTLGWAVRPALLGAAWRMWRRSDLALDRLARFLAAFAALPAEP